MIALPAHSTTMDYSIYDVRKRATTEGQLALAKISSSIRKSLSSTMPFPWEMLESIKSGDGLPISEVIKYELPVLIPAALGILIAILVLIVTPCFFCCRCCGSCGARLKTYDIRKQNRCCMFVTGGFILVGISFLCFTAFSSLESGVVLRKSPRMVLDTLNSSLEDIPAFVTHFGNEMSLLVGTELNATLNLMQIKVGDLPNILSAPLTDIAGSVMTDVDFHLKKLIEGMDNITHLESETNTTLQNIQLLSDSLRDGIMAVNSNLTQLKTQCVTDGETFCHLLLDPSVNPSQVNVSELSDMSSTIADLVSDLNSVNLTEIQNLGNESLTSLPETIYNSSRSAVTGVLDELDKIPGTVLPELDSVLEFTNMSRSSLGMDSTLDSLKDMVDEFDSLTSPTVDKVVLPLVSSYMGIIAFLVCLGVLLGILCGSRGTNRSTASHTGSTCLMCTVLLSILPVMLFMIVSSVLLVVGSNVSIICTPIQDLTFIEKIENGYLDLYSKDMLKDTLNITISIKKVFETCRNKGTVYSGLDLGDKFNLSSFINISSFVPELGSGVYDQINETIRDMNILDTELLDNLTSSFSFTNITSDYSTKSVKEDLLEVDLRGLSTNITNAVPLIPKQSYADTYTELAQVLMDLDVNERGPLLNALDNIANISTTLEAFGVKLQNSSTTISNELKGLQQFIQTQAIDTVFQGIDDFLDNMALVPVDFIDSVTQKMSESVGKCGILWDIYDSVTGSVCNYLLNSLNGFWLSLYVGGITMVMLMICSCTIEKYFRKPSDLRTFRNTSANASANLSLLADISNNSITSSGEDRALPAWCYRVVKQKRRKRRKHCYTGDQSPRLIKIRMLSDSLGNRNTSAETTVVRLEHGAPNMNDVISYEQELSTNNNRITGNISKVTSNEQETSMNSNECQTVETSRPERYNGITILSGSSQCLNIVNEHVEEALCQDVFVSDEDPENTAGTIQLSTIKHDDNMKDDIHVEHNDASDEMTCKVIEEGRLQESDESKHHTSHSLGNKRRAQRPTLSVCPVRPHVFVESKHVEPIDSNDESCIVVKEDHSHADCGPKHNVNTSQSSRYKVPRPTTLSLCPVRPHPEFVSDSLTGIQCALCKQRARLTDHTGVDPQSLNISTPSARNTETPSPLPQNLSSYNDIQTQLYPVENTLHQSGEIRNKLDDSIYTDDVGVNDENFGQMSKYTEEVNSIDHEGEGINDYRENYMVKVLNEFNTVFGSFSQSPLNANEHGCYSIITNAQHTDYRPYTEGLSCSNKTKNKTGSNGNKQLHIQVKPYREYNNNLDTLQKCSYQENGGGLVSQPNVKRLQTTDNVRPLSMLASNVVSRLPRCNDSPVPIKRSNHMTAYCGRGQGKTTYL